MELRLIQRQVSEGDFDKALLNLQHLLDEPEAIYMQAVCLRYLRRFEEAEAALERLKQLVPEHGRAHQEEGHLHRDAGELDKAITAYRRACRYNPALIAAWQSLADCLSQTGKQAEAKAAEAQLRRLESLPKTVLTATDLIGQGKLLKAEESLRAFLLKHPKHTEAMRLLADIGVRLGVLEDAEYLLESACEFEPQNIQLRIDYIQTLRKRQKSAKARAEARKLLDRDPDNTRFQSLYGVECMHGGDYPEALRMFEKVLSAVPGDPITLTSRGHARKTMGDSEGAVADYRAAAGVTKDAAPHGEAYYALANLKTYRFQDSEITAMEAQAADGNLSYMDRVYLAFALGKAFEDRREFEQSFRHYAEGNRLKKAQSRYTPAHISREFDAQIQVCDAPFFNARKGWGCPAPDPIFIVGLPRAGSTLLEQILSSHSMVDGTLELPNVLSLAYRLRRGGEGGPHSTESKYPAVLAELEADHFKEFGSAFIEDTRIHRQSAPFFIDKMPNNFRHIGLIHLMLPNAKIIDARREAMACCFSGFRQLFAEGQEFSYSLTDLGTYYRDYERLMAHWNRVLPGTVLRVQYEEVVADLEREVRRILDFCGLPFEAACLEYHRTERNIRTPSAEQVRQPIFQSGLDAWKDFAPWLQPLKDALQPSEGSDIREA